MAWNFQDLAKTLYVASESDTHTASLLQQITYCDILNT